MLSLVLTYTKQRFKPFQFSLLALYLLLYALGASGMHWHHLPLSVLLLAVLYLFRLFDDLASKEVDAAKPGRIYTMEQPYRRLLWFCAAFTVLLLLFLGLANLLAFLVLLPFLLVNFLAYRVLFSKGQWRYVLPLLKYPFICFLAMLLAGQNSFIGFAQGLVALSLLPVFLLFESFSDPDFKVTAPLMGALFMIAHVFLWFALPQGGWPLALFAASGAFLLYFAKKKAETMAPYACLLYFLTLRLMPAYEF